MNDLGKKGSDSRIRNCTEQEEESLAAAFRAEGVIRVTDILNADELAATRAWLDELESSRPDGRLSGQELNLHLEHEQAWKVVTNPRLLSAARAALGTEDIACLSSTIFTKYGDGASSKSHVAWHQDLLHWGLDPGEVVTAWIAIDDVDVENGCMHVVPGSHESGLMNHVHNTEDDGNLLMGFQYIPEETFGGPDKLVPLPLRAGQASIHGGFTIHGSMPNLSRRRRCGFTVQLMPVHVKVGDDPYAELDATHERTDDWRRATLVCGEDKYRLNSGIDAQPTFS